MPGKTSGVVPAAVLAAALLGSLGAGPAAAAGPTPRPGDAFSVVSWNMCGEADKCKYRSEPQRKVDAIARSIADHRVDVALLQETCTSHVDLLRGRLGTDWTVLHAVITRNGSPVRCDAPGGIYGVAVALRGPVDSSWATVLPSPAGREQRVALCVRQDARGIQVCNAHFSYDGEDGGGKGDGPHRRRQAAVLAGLTARGTQDGYRTITGGDLNTIPPDEGGGAYANPAKNPGLTSLYAAATECDEPEHRARRGEPSLGSLWWQRKLDYLFVDRSTRINSCDVTTSDYSDHRPVFGVFTLG